MKRNSLDPFGKFNGTKPIEDGETPNAASAARQNQRSCGQISSSLPAEETLRGIPRILIVTSDEVLASKLAFLLRQEGLATKRAMSMKVACELAMSGRFQVVLTEPVLAGGLWQCLADIANYRCPGFQVILVARTFDLREWGRAFERGAFDVLDTLHDLPIAAEVVKRALWAMYLAGVGPNPDALIH